MTGPYGENLYVAKPSGDIVRAVQAWYGEEKLYNYNNPNWQVDDFVDILMLAWRWTFHAGCLEGDYESWVCSCSMWEHWDLCDL
jgi:hypothetical protein